MTRKRLALLVSSIAVAVILIAAAVDQILPDVKTRSLIIVDENQIPRMILQASAAGPATISILGKDQKPQMSIGVDQNGEPAILAYDSAGGTIPLISLSSTMASSAIPAPAPAPDPVAVAAPVQPDPAPVAVPDMPAAIVLQTPAPAVAPPAPIIVTKAATPVPAPVRRQLKSASAKNVTCTNPDWTVTQCSWNTDRFSGCVIQGRIRNNTAQSVDYASFTCTAFDSRNVMLGKDLIILAKAEANTEVTFDASIRIDSSQIHHLEIHPE